MIQNVNILIISICVKARLISESLQTAETVSVDLQRCADGAGEAVIRQRAFTRTHLANQTSERNGTLLPPVRIHSPSNGPGGLSEPLVTIRGSQVLASTFYSLFPISAPHSFSASWFLILILLPRPPPALRHFPSPGNSCSSSDPTGSDPVATSPGSGTSLGWCAPSSTLMEVPPSEPAPGRRTKWGQSLPTLPTLYPLSSERQPAFPSSRELELSPESHLVGHTERKKRRGKLENKETATVIFLKLQHNPFPTTKHTHSGPIFYGL